MSGSGYVAPQGGPAVPPTEQKAVWALVCSIAGFLICPVILHVAGLVLANQSLAAITASQGQLGGEGMAKAARILSIVGLVLAALGLLIWLLIAVVAVSQS